MKTETTYNQAQLLNIQERLNPKLSDEFYAPLSDIRLTLEKIRTPEPFNILDYGACNSPYASLFPNSTYKRADIFECTGVDYLIGEDSKINEKNGAFDLVLSTQVAEHLPDPETYFSEAFRLLKPGGLFFVTTHGMWEEHGVPHDYQRWTVDGLERDLKAAGFVIHESFKLTTSERFFLFHILGRLLRGNLYRKNILHRFYRKIRRMLGRLAGPSLNYLSDLLFRDCRVVSRDQFEAHPFYCGIAILAQKP